MLRTALLLLHVALASCLNAGEAPEPSGADLSFREGVRLFFAGRAEASVAAFDRVVALAPDSAPQLWQRGLSLYYAGRFADGRSQFELHQRVNGNDVENAAWHFLCVARLDGVPAARAALIPISGDARVPMREIHALFAGTGTPAQVLAAAEVDADPATRRDRLCYAHLYLGLYHEALAETALAQQHLLLAANAFRMDHYMGRVAQVHVALRGWQEPAATPAAP